MTEVVKEMEVAKNEESAMNYEEVSPALSNNNSTLPKMKHSRRK